MTFCSLCVYLTFGNGLFSVMHCLFKNTNQFNQAETELKALLGVYFVTDKQVIRFIKLIAINIMPNNQPIFY